MGALAKAEDILERNMGLVLTTAKILLQQNKIQCDIRPLAVVVLHFMLKTHPWKYQTSPKAHVSLQGGKERTVFQNLLEKKSSKLTLPFRHICM